MLGRPFECLSPFEGQMVEIEIEYGKSDLRVARKIFHRSNLRSFAESFSEPSIADFAWDAIPRI